MEIILSLYGSIFFSVGFLSPIPFIYSHKPDFVIPYLTYLGLFFALFRKKILSFLFPPILEISLTKEPDHFAIVEAINQRTGEFADYHLSFGVIVKNVGKAKANNVELYFSGIDSNAVESFDRYSSIPLLRSWAGGETRINSLPSDVPIRFSIGYIAFKQGKNFNFEFALRMNSL